MSTFNSEKTILILGSDIFVEEIADAIDKHDFEIAKTENWAIAKKFLSTNNVFAILIDSSVLKISGLKFIKYIAANENPAIRHAPTILKKHEGIDTDELNAILDYKSIITVKDFDGIDLFKTLIDLKQSKIKEVDKQMRNFKAALSKNQIDIAVQEMSTLSNEVKNSSRGKGLYAILLCKSNKHDAALDFCQKSINVNPSSIELINARTRILLYLNRFKEAVRSAEEAAIVSKYNSGRLSALAYIYMLGGNVKKAETYANKSNELDPDDAFTKSIVSQLMLMRGVVKNGLEMDGSIVRDIVNRMSKYAINQNAVSRFDNALDIYDNLLLLKDATGKDKVSIMFNKAISLAYLDEIDDAIAVMRDVLKLNPYNQKYVDVMNSLESNMFVKHRIPTLPITIPVDVLNHLSGDYMSESLIEKDLVVEQQLLSTLS